MRSIIVAHLRAIQASSEAILALLEDEEAPAASSAACPKCGNAEEGAFADSSVMGEERLTCLKCGASSEAPKEA